MPMILDEALAVPATQRLLRRYGAQKDRPTRDRLVELLAPAARLLAGRYYNRGIEMEDLRQVAVVGLIKALDGYQPSKGDFARYAYQTIVGELRKHFRSCARPVHVPRGAQELSEKVRQLNRETQPKTGKGELSVRELANLLNVSEDDALMAVLATRASEVASLSRVSAHPGKKLLLVENMANSDPDVAEFVASRVVLAQALGRMPPRLRQVLILRYWGEMNQKQASVHLGVSQMQACRLEKKAQFWLRSFFEGTELLGEPIAA
jgi:RNA polymerase sigma-B factor